MAHPKDRGWKAKIHSGCIGCKLSDSWACFKDCPEQGEFNRKWKRESGVQGKYT